MAFFCPNFLNQVNFRTLVVNPILVLPMGCSAETVLDKLLASIIAFNCATVPLGILQLIKSPIIKSKATLFGDKNV